MKWVKIEDVRGDKWEMKFNNIVLGTIFRKPVAKTYSVWISTPLVVRKTISVATKSHEYKTFEEAQAGFDALMKSEVYDWARTAKEYVDLNDKDKENG